MRIIQDAPKFHVHERDRGEGSGDKLLSFIILSMCLLLSNHFYRYARALLLAIYETHW